MEKELDLFTARSGNRRLGECGDRRRRGALEAERSAALKCDEQKQGIQEELHGASSASTV
jgi:hypothetical protein